VPYLYPFLLLVTFGIGSCIFPKLTGLPCFYYASRCLPLHPAYLWSWILLIFCLGWPKPWSSISQLWSSWDYSHELLCVCFSFLFLLAVLELGLRALCLLGKCSITWATPPALIPLLILWTWLFYLSYIRGIAQYFSFWLAYFTRHNAHKAHHIPLYVQTKFSLPVHLLVDSLVVFTHWLLCTAVNTGVLTSLWDLGFSSLALLPRKGTAAFHGSSIFYLLRSPSPVSYTGCTILHSHQ
jgi:hypothetical protein